MAIGVKPNADFLKDSGVKTNAGVIVDSYMRTNIDNIYAAGDAARGIRPNYQQIYNKCHMAERCFRGRDSRI